ncbi:hypothetical protein SBY92_002233 [Candida maltosa Xu316]
MVIVVSLPLFLLVVFLINILLYAESKNQSINGMEVFSLDEGNFYNFFFLGQSNQSQQLVYDTEMYHVYSYYMNSFKYYFTDFCNYRMFIILLKLKLTKMET